jgi:hypothetical protein
MKKKLYIAEATIQVVIVSDQRDQFLDRQIQSAIKKKIASKEFKVSRKLVTSKSDIPKELLADEAYQTENLTVEQLLELEEYKNYLILREKFKRS